MPPPLLFYDYYVIGEGEVIYGSRKIGCNLASYLSRVSAARPLKLLLSKLKGLGFMLIISLLFASNYKTVLRLASRAVTEECPPPGQSIYL